MILGNITKDTDTIKKFASIANTFFFSPGNLHMIDIIFVPDWLKNTIGKTKSNHILYCFFTKIMINTKNLLFFKDLCQSFIQVASGCNIFSERFFNYQTSPLF